VEKFQKSLPHRLQDYNIWSEENNFFYTLQKGLANFESYWLKTFALYKVEAFDIVLEDWLGNPLKKIQKYIYSHS
jgi:hypothetical protein